MTDEEILSNARIVIRELMSEPDALPLISAVAAAANAWQENKMQPVTLGQKDHGSDGLWQWRLDRLDLLQRIPNWNTIPAQVKYFKSECKAKFPSLWAQLVNPQGRTLANLTLNICDLYEKPSAAGRVPQARIKFANKIMAMYDTTKPTGSVVVPPDVPLAVAEGVIYILNNVFGGGWSTLIGMGSLAYAYAVFNHITISNLPIDSDWKGWAAFGLALIFGVGTKVEPPVESIPVAQPQESSMDPMVILKVISVVEGFIPVVEKIIQDIPQLQQDIAQIKAAFAQAQQTPPDLQERINQLAAKVGQLGGHQ